MAKRKPDTFHKARQRIMSDILQFYITHQWPDDNNRCSPAINGFIPLTYNATRRPQAGDLVILTDVMPSKWNIGWLRQVEQEPCRRYLIESLEDQSLCWWSNVGISVMPPENVRERFRWSDKQYDFQSRLAKVFRRGSYHTLRLQDTAFDGDDAVIITHERWSFAREEHDKPAPFIRRIKDWRKFTMPKMKEVLDQMEADYRYRRDVEKQTNDQS